MESRTGICTYVTVLTSKNGDGQEFHLNHLYLKATLLYSAALSPPITLKGTEGPRYPDRQL